MHWITTILQACSRPLQWWVVIAPWEQGIRVRLGKTAGHLLSGIHFRIPFLDRIYVQSIRTQTLWETGQTVSSKDGHVLTLSIAIHYSIKDVVALYNSMATPETTIRTRCAALVIAYVSSKNRDEITPQGIREHVQENLAGFTSYGLASPDFTIVGFAFSRAYRIMMNDYQHGGNLWSLDNKDTNGSR